MDQDLARRCPARASLSNSFFFPRWVACRDATDAF